MIPTRVFKTILVGILLMGSLYAQEALLYQRHLESTVQNTLDYMLGKGKSIVYISFSSEDEKWEINYTKMPEIPGMKGKSSRKGQQTIVPGIPSLRFLSGESGGGSDVPLNYEVIQRSPKVLKKDVIIILDKKTKLGDLRSVKNFVTKFLDLDEKNGDKITILKEKFSTSASGSTSKSKISSRKRGGSGSLLWIIVAALVGIALLAILGKLFLGKKGKKEDGEGNDAGASSDSAGASGAGAGEGALGEGGSGGGGDDSKTPEEREKEELEQSKKDEENKIKAANDEILGNGSRFFDFVNEDNIHKLKFLLQIRIALMQATPKTVSVVMSCLPFKLASEILTEYPIKIQAEISSNMLVLQHFPEKELMKLEEEIKTDIDYIFGGKKNLKLLLERIPGDEKKKLLKIIDGKYPAVARDLSSLIVLFEDVMQLEQSVIGRIVSDMDTEVIATALVRMDGGIQKKVVETLPKGVQSMVDQWLVLKSNTASRFDVEQARTKVVNHAQHLDREGFIKIGSD